MSKGRPLHYRIWCTISASLFILTFLSAQVSIWSDNFGAVANGAQSSAAGNWRVTYSNDCNTPGVFGAFGGAFIIQDVEGSNCAVSNDAGDNDNTMTIGPIDISSAACARLEYTVSGSGGSDGFELPGFPGEDYLEIVASIDGAPFNAYVYVGTDVAFTTTEFADIPPGNEVTITITGGTKAADEVFAISNISIVDVTIPYVLPPVVGCTGELVDLSIFSPPAVPGIWTGPGVTGTFWDTDGLSTGNYTLTYEPVPGGCGRPMTTTATLNGGSTGGDGNLSTCGTGIQAFFNLNDAAAAINRGNGQPVFWFSDPLKMNQIPNPGSYAAGDGDIVFGAFQDGSCLSATGEITLSIISPAQPEPPADVVTCDFYSLPSLDPGLSYVNFNQGDQISTTQRIVIEGGVGNCRDTASFLVTINTAPLIDPYSGVTEVCDSFQLPAITGMNLSGSEAYYTRSGGVGDRYFPGDYYGGFGLDTLFIFDQNNNCPAQTQFTVNIGQQAVINMSDTIVCDTFAFPPFNGTGTFIGYFTNPGGTGTQFNVGDGIKRPPGDAQFYIRAGEGNCITEQAFNVRFRLAPDIASISSFDVCDTLSLPRIAGSQLSGNEAYYSMPGGTGTRYQPGFLIDTTTTLYVYDRIGSCFEELLFTVLVIPAPKIDPISDVIACDTFVLPPITGEDLSGSQAYWTSSFGTGNVYDPGDTITSSQTLYIYDERARCTNQDTFDILVNRLPDIQFPIGDSSICDTFILPAIQGGNLSGNEVYTSEILGLGDTLAVGTAFTDSIQLFLFAGVMGCQDTARLNLFIEQQPRLALHPDTVECDYYILPVLGGTGLTNQVAYYDAPSGNGNRYRGGDTLFLSGIYYAYDSTGIGCIAEDTFQVDIGISPSFAPVSDTVACTQFILPSMQGTNLLNAGYYTQTLGGGMQLSVGDTLMSTQRVYQYANDLICFDSTSFLVNVIFQTDITLGFQDTSVCDSFELPPIVAINSTGTEAYYTEPGGMGIRLEPGDIVSDSMQLFIYGGLDVCIDEDTIQINILPSPNLDPISDLQVCDFYVLPIITGTNLTGNEAYFNQSGQSFSAGDTIRSTMSMIARDSNPFACITEVPFEIVVTPTPVLGMVSNQIVCDTFRLGPILGEFIPNSAFYSIVGGTQVLMPGDLLMSSDTIQVIADSLGCRDEASFSITVDYTPVISNAIGDTLTCDSFQLPTLVGNNLSANTAYYTNPNGNGQRINLPTVFSNDTTLFLYGNNNLCILEEIISIEVRTVNATLIISDSIDCNGGNGQIDLSIDEGSSPFDIDWNIDSLDGRFILSNIEAGIYTVNISDQNSCTFSESILLAEPTPLLASCNVLNQVSVPNGMDANVELAFTGGTLPYRVIISGTISDTLILTSSDVESLNNLGAGDYFIQVTDAKNCLESCSFTITAPPCLLEVNALASDISCNGARDGQINLGISNAQAPLVIDWNVDSLDGRTNVGGLVMGAYEVIVTDTFACKDTAMVNINEPRSLQVIGREEQPVTDNTSNDGIASIVFSGGVAPYQVVWDGPVTDTIPISNPDSVVINNLPPGVYILGVIDANNCILSTTITIKNPNCGMQVNFIKQDQSCPNTMDGQLIPTVNGGVAPFSFVWSDGSRDSIRSNLAAGTYLLTVLDSETCVATVEDSLIVTNPLPSITFSVDTSICEATCNPLDLAFSGTAPFLGSFQINDGLDISTGTINSDSSDAIIDICWEDFRNPSVEIVFNTLQDANCATLLDTSIQFALLRNDTNFVRDRLCQNDTLFVAGNPYFAGNSTDTIILGGQATSGCDSIIVVDLRIDSISRIIYEPTICLEDSLIINGTVYNFNNPTGFETLDNQAQNGCDSVIVVELQFFPSDTSLYQDTLCIGEIVSIGLNQFDSNSPSGLARIPGAASTGCDSIVEVAITYVNEFNTSFTTQICAEDSVIVNGRVYNQFNLSGTEVFTASGGCDSIVRVDLSLFPIDTFFINPTLCPGDSLLVNGTVYNESNPIGIETIAKGAANGCDSIIMVDLNYLPNVMTTFRPTICLTDTVMVNGISYHAGRTTGMEIFTNQAQNGCDSIVNVDLQFFPEIRTIYTDTLCATESITVNGVVYDFNQPRGVERIRGGGTNACDSIVEVDLTFLNPITASIGGEASICQGTSTDLILRLSGDTRYDISYRGEGGVLTTLNDISDGHTFTVSPMNTTTFEIVSVVGLTSNCTGSQIVSTVTVSVSQLDVQIQLENDFGGFGISCDGESDGSLSVNTNGGIAPFNITWNTGANQSTIRNLSAGTYSVIVNDGGGCTGRDTFDLTAPDPLTLSSDSNPSICPDNPNGTIRINSISGGAGPYEYSIDGMFFAPLDNFPLTRGGLSPGTYPLLIQDMNDCRTSQEIVIGEKALVIDLGPDQTISIGDSIRLMPTSNFDLVDFTWTPTTFMSNPSSSTPFVSPELTNAYTIMATDSSGCMVTDAITIFVDQSRGVFSPSAFTPNEDGINDRFTIFGGPDLVEIEELFIFNRWGNLMYQERGLAPSNDQLGWNGEFRNQPMPSGAYIFRAILLFSNGEKKEISGEVSLIR